MKRMIVFSLLMGMVAFGLAACSDKGQIANLPASSDAPASTDASASTDAPASADAGVGDTAAVAQSTGENDTAGDVGNTGTDASASAAAARTRGPISILGDADFTAENGVVRGTGTDEDPYILSAWEISVPAGEVYGVRIENVTATFVLRGLIIQNAHQSNGAGIRIGFASGGVIDGCVVSDSMHGIDIVSSTDLSIRNCALYVSGRGLRVVGETEDQYRHDIAESNLYNNQPIYYFYGLDGDTITGLKTGHLTVAASRNVTISNNEVVNGDGLLLAFVEDSTVQLNLAHRVANVTTEHGIHLYESHRNLVTQNVVKNNRLAGIQLTLSSENSILGNFTHVNDTGIRVLASDGNEISGNNIYSCVTGIILLGASADNVVEANQVYDDRDSTAEGIALEAAVGNHIRRNLIFGAEMGLILEQQSVGNTLTDNTVTSGSYGIFISGAGNVIERNLISQQTRGILFRETFQASTTQGNTFRGNVLADNNSHVYTNGDSTNNRFTENIFLNRGINLVYDRGSGNVWTVNGRGNYWGGADLVDADGDGIGDAPVTIYPADVDDTAPLVGFDARQLGLGIVGTLELGVTTIETKRGDRIEVAAYLANEPVAQSTGFRGFPSELIARFPGILFDFGSEIETRFTMSTVPFDLDIAFFDASGEWVGGTTMEAQATTLYTAGVPFQYALELPSGSLDGLGIGSGSKLILP